jgi:hypothetical protein
MLRNISAGKSRCARTAHLNGLSLKSLIFPVFVACAHRIGSALLRVAARWTPISTEGWEGVCVLREEVRGSPGFDQASGAAMRAADLARGLTFLRASNMQVMRLQLAMERADRRGVMAAIDELVGLDRELARFIETIPDPELDDIGREIDARKHELMEQRVVLARGKLGPALRPVPDAPAPPAELLLSKVAPAPEWMPEKEEEARPRHRWPWIAFFLLVALLAAAAALYLWFGDQLGLDARLAALLESVR